MKNIIFETDAPYQNNEEILMETGLMKKEDVQEEKLSYAKLMEETSNNKNQLLK